MLAVTSTVTVQVSPAPTLPPLKVIVPPPSAAVTMPSTQVVEAFAGSAIATAPGKTSVKASSVTVPPALLPMVKVRVVVLPGPIVLGENAFEKAGGPFTATAPPGWTASQAAEEGDGEQGPKAPPARRARCRHEVTSGARLARGGDSPRVAPRTKECDRSGIPLRPVRVPLPASSIASSGTTRASTRWDLSLLPLLP